MIRRFLAVPACCLLAFTAPAPAQQQVENVAAFARLYGVARWFYPSDAAASMDWNKFAVHGVSRVRGARTPQELKAALEALFTPLGPDIHIGTTLPGRRAPGRRDPSLVAWHYRGPGITENVPGPYSMKRINRVTENRNQSTAAFGTVLQTLVADTLRGKTIRMRGHLRVADPSSPGWAGLWLRVDRAGGAPGGFFDNMQDRPVRDTTWREYVIEGPVAPDATQIVFGVITVSGKIVDADAIEIEVRDAGSTWSRLTIPDASFEAPANSSARGWTLGGTSVVTRPSSGAAHGTQFARVTPPAAGPASPSLPADSLETPIAGATIDIELARGLKARVPLSLTDAEARVEASGLGDLRDVLAKMAPPARRDDIDVRLADAIVAWAVFRHFYPYWLDTGLDWDAHLGPQLENAISAPATRQAHLDVVRKVVADIRDGHGSVRDLSVGPQWTLPVQFRILRERLVVTASRDTAVPVGSVVTTIDGTPASTRINKETQLASGTLQWRRSRAAGALQTCRVDSVVTVTIELPSGNAREARLACNRSVPRAVETRPDSITQLQPGIWYVDLTRIRAAQLRPMLDTLAKARAVVFDMRGYPTDAGSAVLPHLMRTPEDSTDRWMHVPRFARPFGEVIEWQSMSWHLHPASPHIGGQRVFLTDGRAISYAESVMGYVRDYKLGTIIGGATAGANGNVANFTVPGGFSITFTGMRVTRHDGRTPFHMSGVGPEIPLEPTLEGIRAGRDELLERALATLRIAS